MSQDSSTGRQAGTLGTAWAREETRRMPTPTHLNALMRNALVGSDQAP